MSVEYSARVFFGTWAPRRSALGKRLEAIADEHGGSPAPTSVMGVQVTQYGSWSTGDYAMAIIAKGSAHRFGRHDDVEPPTLLSDPVQESRWKDALTLFFAAEGIDPSALPPVGWYFAGSVS